MKQESFQAVAVSVLQYGCTTFTLTIHFNDTPGEKKQDGNYTSMQCACFVKH